MDYSTSQIAKIFQFHPNTIRLYEKWGFISTPKRKANGYRIYTDKHIKQIEIARIALKAEVLQNGLRKKAIQIIKTVALENYDLALSLTNEYMFSIDNEISFSQNAIKTVENILKKEPLKDSISFTRKQAAENLNITIDTLRNWELNGLVTIKRKQNRNCVYNETDMQRLLIIRELRVANYSLSAILRMINELEKNKSPNLEQLLNLPNEDGFITSVCDRLIISLKKSKNDAIKMRKKIVDLK